MASLVVLFPATAFTQQSSSSATSEVVWIWSKSCTGQQEIGVIVRLRNKTLYRGILPICRSKRNAEDGRVNFHVSGNSVFQGEYRTHSKDSIEGDIWQAGGEKDDLILGISFENKRQVLLNTLHIAKPDQRTSSELDKGLFVTTYPVFIH